MLNALRLFEAIFVLTIQQLIQFLIFKKNEIDYILNLVVFYQLFTS